MVPKTYVYSHVFKYICMYGYLFEIKFINKKDKSTTTTATTVEGPLFKYKKKKINYGYL